MLKSTKEDWVSDIQEHLRTISGESFRPLPSLYSLSKGDAMKLENILSQVIYNTKSWFRRWKTWEAVEADIKTALDSNEHPLDKLVQIREALTKDRTNVG